MSSRTHTHAITRGGFQSLTEVPGGSRPPPRTTTPTSFSVPVHVPLPGGAGQLRAWGTVALAPWRPQRLHTGSRLCLATPRLRGPVSTGAENQAKPPVRTAHGCSPGPPWPRLSPPPGPEQLWSLPFTDLRPSPEPRAQGWAEAPEGMPDTARRSQRPRGCRGPHQGETPPQGVTSTWGSLVLVGASEGGCGRGHKPSQGLKGRGPARELGLPRRLSGKDSA